MKTYLAKRKFAEFPDMDTLKEIVLFGAEKRGAICDGFGVWSLPIFALSRK